MLDETPLDPVAAEAIRERQELFRIAAQRVVDAHKAGRRTDPEALKWARGIVARVKPLGRPLSSGDYPTQPESKA